MAAADGCGSEEQHPREFWSFKPRWMKERELPCKVLKVELDKGVQGARGDGGRREGSLPR